MEDGEAFRILQEAGVPRGLSLDMGRLHAERQLNEGGYLRGIEYPDGSEKVLPTLPWRFDGRADLQLGPAPELGRDSGYVYSELLGLSDGEIEGLVEERVIY